MATWTDGKELNSEILNALEEWCNKCLLNKGSVFTEKNLWTEENFSFLENKFVENPIYAEGGFFENLKIQLNDAPVDVVQLASEMLYLLILFVNKDSFTIKKKIYRITELWDLSKESIPNSEKLSKAVLDGFVVPGKRNFMGEYVYFIQIMKQWKALKSDEQFNLLKDRPFELCSKISSFVGDKQLAIRHMFLYYCYPNYYERISSTAVKKRIHKTYSNLLEDINNPYKQDESLCNLDIAIYNIRKCLEKLHGTNELDFYSGVYSNGEWIDLHSEWISEENSSRTKQGNSDSISVNDQTSSTAEDHPLNQIFYGPPGTGKTWEAVNHAIAIINDCTVKELEIYEREDIIKRFNELKENKQVGMVTFHQSFTYEDFVEGIKPNLDPTEEKFDFVLEDGIFKIICDKAKEYRNVQGPKFDINLLLDAFAEHVQEKLDDGEFFLYERGGKRVIINKVNSLKRGEFRSFVIVSGKHPRYFTHSDIKTNYPLFYEGKIKSQKDIKPYKPDKSLKQFELCKKIKEYHENEWEGQEDFGPKKFVLIVDEINRGNIAKIFGELITLIEDTKRLGKTDEASVILPYSKESFCIPDNVHIIGTMNTADRSIALLDTALRRRFEFVEMMPNPFHDDIDKNVDSIDLQKLLDIMNKKIEILLDREHQIGHTYFLGIKEIEKLKKIFQNKIIPLLQEYFYDDWGKIDLVLNKNGFIKSVEIPSSLLENDKDGLIDSQKKIYKILPEIDPDWDKAENYIQIYESNSDRTKSQKD